MPTWLTPHAGLTSSPMSSATHVSQPAAITIGNFDGVHRGHAELVRSARNAVGQDGRIIVLVFDPNPMTVLRPTATPARLSTFSQRARWLREIGANDVVRIEPTREFLQQSPEQFIAACVDRWHPTVIVEGADFHFGRGRAGTIATLRESELRFGYRTEIVDSVEVALADQSLVRVSSSLVRWLLAHGRVQDVATLLGRPYEVEARIERGDQRGRTIGFPTANLAGCEHILPADGIYAGIAERIDGHAWYGPAAISIGTKPTFGKHPRTCEAHLLDYDGPVDDYGWTIRLRFTHWMRDQLKYDGVDALIAQLHRDIAATRDCERRSPGVSIPGIGEAHRA